MSQIKILEPETFRFNIKNKLNDIIGNAKMASNMEKGIFNYSLKEAKNKKVVKKWDNPGFVQIYMDRTRSIIYNLNKNSGLLEQLKNDTIKAQDIAFMTHYEMSPEKWKTMLQVKSEKDKGNLKQISKHLLIHLLVENARVIKQLIINCKFVQPMNLRQHLLIALIVEINGKLHKYAPKRVS
jgi:Transcription factor S-II (TFIIS), central domain